MFKFKIFQMQMFSIYLDQKNIDSRTYFVFLMLKYCSWEVDNIRDKYIIRYQTDPSQCELAWWRDDRCQCSGHCPTAVHCHWLALANPSHVHNTIFCISALPKLLHFSCWVELWRTIRVQDAALILLHSTSAQTHFVKDTEPFM